MKSREFKFAKDTIEPWLQKYYPEDEYDIRVRKSGGKDISICRKARKAKLVLQVEVKIDDYYSIIGQGFDRLYNQNEEVPTFIAVPYDEMKTEKWDVSAIVDVFQHFNGKVGAIVYYQNNVSAWYNPWGKKTRFKEDWRMRRKVNEAIKNESCISF
jgi:serine protease inhibitor ecotin